jgi:pimeloyl-ACP methyl ester carboxylesterase
MNRLLALGGGVLASAVAVYAGIAIYGAHKVTRRRHLLPEITPDTISPAWEGVSFRSRGDGLQLHGWWFPAKEAHRALVLVHGHGQNRADKNWGSDAIARAFLARGYSVLMFDLRGHGESARSRQSYGVREKNDVLGAFDYVRGRGFRPGAIAMVGVSYGAGTLLMAASELQEVGAIVADSGYAEIWPVIAAEIPRYSPFFALVRPGPGIRLASRLLYRIDLRAARPESTVALIPERPILFIHGAIDAYIPPSHGQRLRAGSVHPASELWLVPDADHAQTYMKAPDEYIERVAAFFDAQMGSPVSQHALSDG